MSRDDFEYYESRAEAALELAQKAKNSAVVQAHYQMAAAYLDRIHGAADKEPQAA